MIYYEKIRWASLTLHITMQFDHQVFVPGQEVASYCLSSAT